MYQYHLSMDHIADPLSPLITSSTDPQYIFFNITISNYKHLFSNTSTCPWTHLSLLLAFLLSLHSCQLSYCDVIHYHYHFHGYCKRLYLLTSKQSPEKIIMLPLNNKLQRAIWILKSIFSINDF